MIDTQPLDGQLVLQLVADRKKKESVQSPGKPRFFLVVRKFPYFYCSATEPRRLPAGFIVLCLFAEPSGYSYPGKPSVVHDNDLGLLHNWGKAK